MYFYFAEAYRNHPPSVYMAHARQAITLLRERFGDALLVSEPTDDRPLELKKYHTAELVDAVRDDATTVIGVPAWSLPLYEEQWYYAQGVREAARDAVENQRNVCCIAPSGGHVYPGFVGGAGHDDATFNFDAIAALHMNEQGYNPVVIDFFGDAAGTRVMLERSGIPVYAGSYTGLSLIDQFNRIDWENVDVVIACMGVDFNNSTEAEFHERNARFFEYFRKKEIPVAAHTGSVSARRTGMAAKAIADVITAAYR